MQNIKPILKGWLQSSADPTQVSNKVKGVVLACSSFIIFFAAQFFHVQLSANDIISLATELGTLAGVIWFFYGLLMHGVIKVGSIKPVSYSQTVGSARSSTSMSNNSASPMQ